MDYNNKSKVEKYFVEESGYKQIYSPIEKIDSIVVSDFPKLGKLSALRFIEWVQNNPGGVISLPTGKTPEYFIKWTKHFIDNWDKKEIKTELEKFDIATNIKPDFKSLHFVQIDEFYPILPTQQNSFYYYIQKYYIDWFGLDKDKALLINTKSIGIPDNKDVIDIFPDYKVDLSLRYRLPKTKLESLQKDAIIAIDQFCSDYEAKINDLGGIGFFLGGIGPDGHIGFNISGSDFYSTTRLTPINYETAAAAATDLGGIEISRERLVITIGLKTITQKKNVTVIIFAAGESKADIVKNSIEGERDIKYPASVLQNVQGARFYLTKGAAKGLDERNFFDLTKKKVLSKEDMTKSIMDLSINKFKPLDDLVEKDIKEDRFASFVSKKTKKSLNELRNLTKETILTQTDNGLKNISNEVILHTAPHHDDIMLGYLPFGIHMFRNPTNSHHFSYMTSGFTSVTNKYTLELCKNLKHYITSTRFKEKFDSGYFESDNLDAKNNDIYFYLDGIASKNETYKNKAQARRLLRILVEIYEETDLDNIKNRINELISYFETQYPGKKDLPHIQKIKGMVREWEAEILWGYFGFNLSNVSHERLSFYTGDIFTKQPELETDVIPVYNLLKKVSPSIVTVAFDPEGSGPDTHYKVLQAISEALKKYEKDFNKHDIKVWGYRNVWFKYHPSEANMFVPVSLNSLAALRDSFMNCFGSQRKASFPSYAYDGPFADLAQEIFVEQYKKLLIMQGKDYFFKNPQPRIRSARGFLYLKEMNLKEFYDFAEELKKITE